MLFFEVLADHSALEALPFFGPMLLVVLGLAFLVVRDRRRNGRDADEQS